MTSHLLLAICLAFLPLYPVHAEIRRAGLDGTRERDVISISVTQYAPTKQTVKLTTPSSVAEFVEQFRSWHISDSALKNFTPPTHANFIPLYEIAVTRAKSSYIVVFVVEPALSNDRPYLLFSLWTQNRRKTYDEYLRGAGRHIIGPPDPIERYLSGLFN